MKKIKTGIIATGIAGASLVLAGCGGGPTYGTDKSSSQQLVDDFSNIVSIRSNNNTNRVETKPRPELVRPSEAARSQLPKPQANVASAGAPDWPESPEQRRARLRAEATENQDNPNYVSPIQGGGGSESKGYLPSGIDRAREREDRMPNASQGKKQRAEYQRRKKESQGGTATQRKYLSEPPLAYRKPADSAPVDDQGTDEAKKERERKAAAKGKSDKKWWQF